LATPIIGVLVGTPNQWLHDIVTALSIGDIDTFTTTMELHREKYFSQIALSSSVELVKRKAVLLTLVNMAFERPAHDRSINFTDISRRTRIPIDQVSVWTDIYIHIQIFFLRRPSDFLAGGMVADEGVIRGAGQGED